jgi:hypothetical protein
LIIDDFIADWRLSIDDLKTDDGGPGFARWASPRQAEDG